MQQGEMEIKRLFDIYVKPRNIKYYQLNPCKIKFENRENGPHYIWGCTVKGKSYKYTYDDQGVQIEYWKRTTTYKGDTDTFTDYSIKIDGKIILDVKYE